MLNATQLADSGSYTVIVSNADGQATSTAATVSIRPLPVIITQPQTQIITLSNSVTFTVEASSPNETVLYQWVKNGYSIPGSTNSSLTITNVQTTDAGTYAVYVGNSVGYIASEPALLIVLPIQPMKIAKDQILGQVLQMAPMPNGQMGFLYYGAIGKTYDIQASSDTFTWETLAEVVPTQNINQFIDTHAAEFTVRFYRVALKLR